MTIPELLKSFKKKYETMVNDEGGPLVYCNDSDKHFNYFISFKSDFSYSNTQICPICFEEYIEKSGYLDRSGKD